MDKTIGERLALAQQHAAFRRRTGIIGDILNRREKIVDGRRQGGPGMGKKRADTSAEIGKGALRARPGAAIADIAGQKFIETARDLRDAGTGPDKVRADSLRGQGGKLRALTAVTRRVDVGDIVAGHADRALQGQEGRTADIKNVCHTRLHNPIAEPAYLADSALTVLGGRR